MKDISYKTIKVTVFGGSKPVPGDPEYENATKLGTLLGSVGCTVLTGGYIGTMEAVSKGAALSGGHVVGVTCDEIESWRQVAPNQWIMEERRYPKLRQRLYALIEGCDIALVLPGGIGTLAEAAVMWSQVQTGASDPRPIVFIGSGWKKTMKAFFESLGEYVSAADRQWLHFSENVNQSYQLLQQLYPQLGSGK
jgi:uncharacterized protein (TIGR00730 family)